MFDFSAVLVLLISGGIGIASMFGANAAGLENGTGIGLIVAGVVAFFFSQQQANAGTRNSILFVPCWAIGLAAAIAGGLTFAMGGTPQFGKPEISPEQEKRLARIVKILKTHPVSSSKAGGDLATKTAERVKSIVGGRKGLNANPRVHFEVDNADQGRATRAVVWIQADNAGQLDKRRLQPVVLNVIQHVEKTYPAAKVKVAVRSPKAWVAQPVPISFSKRPITARNCSTPN